MKTFVLLILIIVCMGLTSKPEETTFYNHPTQKEIAKRKELKLELTRSKVEVQIAEIKQLNNID